MEGRLMLMQPDKPEGLLTLESRHRLAVTQGLRFAVEAAAAGELKDALEWLRVVESIDGPLSPEWEERRLGWLDERSAGDLGPPPKEASA